MPHSKSAKKRLRQSIKRMKRNKKVKREIKDLIKKTKKLAEQKANEKEVLESLYITVKKIDKAVSNKVFKKNTGARKKSRLIAYIRKYIELKNLNPKTTSQK